MRTITLLPGLACDAALWTSQIEVLRADWAVNVSEVHQRHAGLPQMAAALLAEQRGELILCGASMGGMLALEVWRQAPQRVRAMALLGTSARPDTAELLRLRTEAIKLFEQGRWREVLIANVAFAFEPRNASADTTLAPRYVHMIERAGARQLIAQNRAVMARPDSRPLLPEVDCPVLVACGDADLLTPPNHSSEMAALLPHAELHIIESCGHMLTMERPSQVNGVLRDWLGRL